MVKKHACIRLITLVIYFLKFGVTKSHTCTYFDEYTEKFLHWTCEEHTSCCVYGGKLTCCYENGAYMNTGGSTHPNYPSHGWFEDFVRKNTNVCLVILILVSLLGFLICCLCDQYCKARRSRIEEEEEMRLINEMIANSEMDDSLRLYRPEYISPQLATTSSDVLCGSTSANYPQPPSYDSISKDELPGERFDIVEDELPPSYDASLLYNVTNSGPACSSDLEQTHDRE